MAVQSVTLYHHLSCPLPRQPCHRCGYAVRGEGETLNCALVRIALRNLTPAMREADRAKMRAIQARVRSS